MKQEVNPVVIGIAITIVVVVIAVFGWRAMGKRSDGPTEPINMAKVMGGGKGGATPGTGGH